MSLRADSSPFISIVMPVRNEALFIGKTLHAFLHQDYPTDRYEILVVDGESTDETPKIVQLLQASHPNIKLFANPKKLASAARNIGVHNARGELLAIVDGHCDVSDPAYLRHLADAFERSGADCLGRPQPLDVTGASTLQRAIAAARSSWLGHHPASFIYSGAEQFVQPQSVAVAYRRSVFEKLGGFDETFDACEDVEFNQRVHDAGMRCFFTPKIAVPYVPRGTLRRAFSAAGPLWPRPHAALAQAPPYIFVGELGSGAFRVRIAYWPVLGWFVPVCGLDFRGLSGSLRHFGMLACRFFLRGKPRRRVSSRGYCWFFRRFTWGRDTVFLRNCSRE